VAQQGRAMGFLAVLCTFTTVRLFCSSLWCHCHGPTARTALETQPCLVTGARDFRNITRMMNMNTTAMICNGEHDVLQQPYPSKVSITCPREWASGGASMANSWLILLHLSWTMVYQNQANLNDSLRAGEGGIYQDLYVCH
jgi:hypothetical protein